MKGFNNTDRVSAQEAFENLLKRITLDHAWVVVETRLLILHEAHVGELDIPLMISHLEAEEKELWELLDLV